MIKSSLSVYRRCEAGYIRAEMGKYGLLPLEGKLLVLLGCRCRSQEELVSCMELDKGSIAKAVFSLEEKQLVTRETDRSDRRRKLVSLTSSGREMLVNINRIFEAWDAVRYKGFTEEEKQMHQQFLDRIAQNALNYKNGGNIHG